MSKEASGFFFDLEVRSKTVDTFSQFEIFHGYVSKMACRLKLLPYSMLLTTHFSRVFVTTYCPTCEAALSAISVDYSSRFQNSDFLPYTQTQLSVYLSFLFLLFITICTFASFVACWKFLCIKKCQSLQRIRCLVDSRFHAENCRKLWASHYPFNKYQFVYARHSGRWKPKTKIGEPSETSTIHPNKHTRIHACISCEANVTRDMNPKLTCPFSSVKITTVLYLASICQHAFCENANAWCWSLWNDRKRDGEECGDGGGMDQQTRRAICVRGREWERGKQKDNTHEFNHY